MYFPRLYCKRNYDEDRITELTKFLPLLVVVLYKRCID